MENKQEISQEYESRLARANNQAELFLNSKVHNMNDYMVVINLFGQVEQIGAHVNRTYIDWLTFYIKANGLEDIIIHDSEKIEKNIEELSGLAIRNSVDENEKEEIRQEFNKQTIMNQLKGVLEIKQQKTNRKNKNKRVFGIIIVSVFVILISLSICLEYISTKRNSSVRSVSTTNTTIDTKKTVEDVKNELEDRFIKEIDDVNNRLLKVNYPELGILNPQKYGAFAVYNKNSLEVTAVVYGAFSDNPLNTYSMISYGDTYNEDCIIIAQISNEEGVIIYVDEEYGEQATEDIKLLLQLEGKEGELKLIAYMNNEGEVKWEEMN